ncbi:MAG TPA: ATP synthase F1 subunit gamma [bacterium]|nr:ATP synthase F1 subunit gamma [bacterium]
MQNPRELKRRIATIQNIERTVDAMQKISAARLNRERVRVQSNRPYIDAMLELVGDIAATSDLSHPLLDVRDGSGYLLLCIGTDRGMCGAYNTNVMRAASAFIATRHRERLFLVTAGRKLRRFTPRTNATIIREVTHFAQPPSTADVESVAATITDAFLHKDAVRAYVVYTEFHSAAGNRPVVKRILPVMPVERRIGNWLCEPSPQAVLDRLMPQYVRAALHHAFLEASASEHAARMVMMEQASVSARRMIDELTLLANKLRQQTITRELSDIVGTAEALSG